MRIKKSVTIEQEFDEVIKKQVEISRIGISYSDVLNDLLAKSIDKVKK